MANKTMLMTHDVNTAESSTTEAVWDYSHLDIMLFYGFSFCGSFELSEKYTEINNTPERTIDDDSQGSERIK
jgi:hypothetical protein